MHAPVYYRDQDGTTRVANVPIQSKGKQATVFGHVWVADGQVGDLHVRLHVGLAEDPPDTLLLAILGQAVRRVLDDADWSLEAFTDSPTPVVSVSRSHFAVFHPGTLTEKFRQPLDARLAR